MASKTLQDIAETMRDIDFTMLFTRSENGALAGRPMSNNRDVAYDGDSYFFTMGDTRKVQDIGRDPQVAMSLQGSAGLFGKPPMFIAIEGKAELIRDRQAFDAHWNPDLERWFAQGADTPGLTLIKVHASRIHWWHGEDEGDLKV